MSKISDILNKKETPIQEGTSIAHIDNVTFSNGGLLMGQIEGEKIDKRMMDVLQAYVTRCLAKLSGQIAKDVMKKGISNLEDTYEIKNYPVSIVFEATWNSETKTLEFKIQG